MQMPAFSPAQISESRAEASGMLSRQPRLETREAPGGASQQPYHPNMFPQAPMLGSDMGVYVKWALLLQEQLDHVQTERAKLQQHVTQLQIENQQLQKVRVRASPPHHLFTFSAHVCRDGRERDSKIRPVRLLLWQALQEQGGRDSASAAAPESTGALPAGGGGSQEIASATCTAYSACASGVLDAASSVESGNSATPVPVPAESGFAAAPGGAACCAAACMSSAGAQRAAGTAAPGLSSALDLAQATAVAHPTGLPAQAPLAASVDSATTPAPAGPQDPLSSPNLRYLATFLDHGAADGTSLQNAEPAAEAAQGGKRQRRATQTGKALLQFDALAQGVYGMGSGDPDGQAQLGGAFGAIHR